MHPTIRHAVNGVLRLAPDFPVERYTWIVDPKGFIGGTGNAVRELWPEFGSLALERNSDGDYWAVMRYDDLVGEKLAPRLPWEWLSVAAGADDYAEFSKLPVLAPMLAIVAHRPPTLTSQALTYVLIVDQVNRVVARLGSQGVFEIDAVAFDDTGAAVAVAGSNRTPLPPLWERDCVIAADGSGWNRDYHLSTSALAVKRAIDLSSSTTVVHIPTRRQHASRRAAGRKPAFEWRTVVIEPRKPKTEHKGGTHASPRQHDRRGHWATSKLGKRFWRPPCKVGRASNGIVFHDYVVKGPDAPTQTPPHP